MDCQGADQIASAVDGFRHRVVRVAPGMALAAEVFQPVMRREQDRRRQHRKAGERLHAPFAQHGRKGGQAVVIAHRGIGAVAFHAGQQPQHFLIQALGEAARRFMARMAPGKIRHRRGRRRIKRDGVTEGGIADFQQHAACIVGDGDGEQCGRAVVAETVGGETKGEHPAVVEMQP